MIKWRLISESGQHFYYLYKNKLSVFSNYVTSSFNFTAYLTLQRNRCLFLTDCI